METRDAHPRTARPESARGGRTLRRESAPTLKRFVRLDAHHVQLRPDSHNAKQKPIRIDLAKHILHIDGVAVGVLARLRQLSVNFVDFHFFPRPK